MRSPFSALVQLLTVCLASVIARLSLHLAIPYSYCIPTSFLPSCLVLVTTSSCHSSLSCAYRRLFFLLLPQSTHPPTTHLQTSPCVCFFLFYLTLVSSLSRLTHPPPSSRAASVRLPCPPKSMKLHPHRPLLLQMLSSPQYSRHL